MKAEKIITLLSIGAIVGFVTGLVQALQHIMAHRYLQYKMYRLVALSLQQYINTWVLVAIFAAVFIFLIWLLFLLIMSLWQALVSDKKESFRKKKAASRLQRLMTGIKVKALCLLLLILFLNISMLVDHKIQVPKGPNILLFVIDCLRPDHLHCYGYQRDTSPTIDSLAQKGIVFTQAYSNAPWTKPSIASVFTSLYPNVHQVINATSALPDQALTLAEIVKNSRYDTYCFNGGNAFIRKEFNFHQGFDVYQYRPHKTKNAKDVTNDFLTQLSASKNTKFFAYLHYMDAHAPYTINAYNNFFVKKQSINFKPGDRTGSFKHIRELTQDGTLSPEDQEYIISLYDGQIRFVDENIKKIITFLDRNNLLENTVIIITSDHGEEFWDHQNFEHGHTLYNELLRVPLIITGPATDHTRITTAVSLIDLLPTILEAAKVKVERVNLQGVSLLRTMKLGIEPVAAPVFASGTLYGAEKYCLINNMKKIVFNTSKREKKRTLIGPHSKAKFEFYDVNKDPLEKDNLINAKTTGAAQLQTVLEKYRKQRPLFQQDESVVVLDAQLKENLQSLGYVQ